MLHCAINGARNPQPATRNPALMSSPTPPENDDDVPFMRLAWWAVLATVLVIGIWLYFRYEGSMTPLLG